MHDVVLLHRCYPSTPHGVGPWLPAPVGSHPTLEVTMHTYSSATGQPIWPQPFTCTACAGRGRTSDWLDSEYCDWCEGTGLIYATPPSLDDGPFVAWLECNGHFVTWLGSAAEADFWMFAPQSSVTCHYLPHDPSVVYDDTGHDDRGNCGPRCNCPF